MLSEKDMLYLHDSAGNLVSVQISAPLWQKIEPIVTAAVGNSETPEDDMRNFGEFLRFWDFSYPYAPSITCPGCGASTKDWKTDEKRPFVLSNANIGGLLVFHCRGCGGTVRHKYFKDHMAVEYTSP